MGRKKKTEYNQTAFSKRITKLQNEHKYTDTYVIMNLTDENDIPLISNEQTLNSYKIGKRIPRDLIPIVCAFARFYHVSTDYLLGYDDVPNKEVAKANVITGLSPDAITALIKFKNSTSYDNNIHTMIDAIISGTEPEDMLHYLNLYQQLYRDYKDLKAQNEQSSYDIDKLQYQFALAHCMYNYWKVKALPKLEPFFEKQMAIEEDIYIFEHSPEVYNQYAQYQDDLDKVHSYVLEDENGNKIILSNE